MPAKPARFVVLSRDELSRSGHQLEQGGPKFLPYTRVQLSGGTDGQRSDASTSFLVHLDGLDVPEKQRAELERAIQGAVLNEVARFDFGAAVGVRIPRREWLGIWLERLGGRDIPMPKITFGGR